MKCRTNKNGACLDNTRRLKNLPEYFSFFWSNAIVGKRRSRCQVFFYLTKIISALTRKKSREKLIIYSSLKLFTRPFSHRAILPNTCQTFWCHPSKTQKTFTSRPSRARGLKPRTGCLTPYSDFESRPSRARGLKQQILMRRAMLRGSRPSRARGLKQSGRLTCQTWRRCRAPRGRVD